MIMSKILCILIVLIGLCGAYQKEYHTSLVNWVKQGESDDRLWQALNKGDMFGYQTHSNFWEIFSMMRTTFPEFVGQNEIIGHTYENDNIEAFKIGKAMDKSSKKSKKSFV